MMSDNRDSYSILSLIKSSFSAIKSEPILVAPYLIILFGFNILKPLLFSSQSFSLEALSDFQSLILFFYVAICIFLLVVLNHMIVFFFQNKNYSFKSLLSFSIKQYFNFVFAHMILFFGGFLVVTLLNQVSSIFPLLQFIVNGISLVFIFFLSCYIQTLPFHLVLKSNTLFPSLKKVFSINTFLLIRIVSLIFIISIFFSFPIVIIQSIPIIGESLLSIFLQSLLATFTGLMIARFIINYCSNN